MFVAELDRPWIDTPFLLQGFLLEDAEQIKQLREFCEWVWIDPRRSVGADFDKPIAKKVPERRDLGTDPRVVMQKVQKPSGTGTPAPAAAPTRKQLLPARGSTSTESKSRNSSAKSRDFAFETKRSSGESAAGGGAPATMRNESPAVGGAGGGLRGLFGQLKESVSHLFAREQEDNPDYDSVEEVVRPREDAVRPGFIPETVLLTVYEDQKTVENEMEAATTAFQRTSELLDKMVADVRSGDNLQLEGSAEVIDEMVDSMVRNPDAMMWVGRLRELDLSSYSHGLTVAINLVAFGRHLGYPKEQLSHLGLIGLLLDIGKLKLPAELLERKSRFTPAEYELVKKHVQLGLQILENTPGLHPDVTDGIAHHHERVDGSGYPLALSGDKISIFGRMAAIADTFSAVTKARPYAETVAPHEALRMLTEWSGRQFQPEMVEQFIQSIGAFPVGSLVELSTGEVAVVVTHNKTKRLRPKVLVVTDPDKTPRRHPSTLDLLYDISDHPVHIRRGLASNAFGIDAREYYLA
ncbi:MAG: DUF3391 domain-containing protein [Betaproteobacteria bacterium]|nr:DUF3391 domain-containing protein [Betaproteobacteria bacterium]